jgi:hypothetical protein
MKYLLLECCFKLCGVAPQFKDFIPCCGVLIQHYGIQREIKVLRHAAQRCIRTCAVLHSAECKDESFMLVWIPKLRKL